MHRGLCDRNAVIRFWERAFLACTIFVPKLRGMGSVLNKIDNKETFFVYNSCYQLMVFGFGEFYTVGKTCFSPTLITFAINWKLGILGFGE